ncbi:MAG: DedA family protein [Gemmatimonadetes bacterium]|nr:DedA family protein [Gemmatimonadota bacterium]
MDFLEGFTGGLLDFLRENVGRFGYPFLFAVTFLETSAFLGLIAPGEAAVVVCGLFASQGPLELAPVLGLSILGAFLGDNAGYWIGRRLGTGLLQRYGRFGFFDVAAQERLARFYERHGGKTVFLGRFASFVRSFGPMVAGSSGMPYPTFAAWSAVGCVAWGTLFTLIGYFFGESWDVIEKYLGRLGLAGFLLGAGLLAFYLHRLRGSQEAKE